MPGERESVGRSWAKKESLILLCKFLAGESGDGSNRRRSPVQRIPASLPTQCPRYRDIATATAAATDIRPVILHSMLGLEKV